MSNMSTSCRSTASPSGYPRTQHALCRFQPWSRDRSLGLCQVRPPPVAQIAHFVRQLRQDGFPPGKGRRFWGCLFFFQGSKGGYKISPTLWRAATISVCPRSLSSSQAAPRRNHLSECRRNCQHIFRPFCQDRVRRDRGP